MPMKCVPAKDSDTQFICRVRKPRPKQAGFSVCGLVWLLVVFGAIRVAALVVSEPAAGSDELPPQPPTNIQASDIPEDAGGRIQLIWNLSADDREFAGGLAISGDLSTYGAIATRAGVAGYRIYRRTKEGEFVQVGEVDAGTNTFADTSAETNELYLYEVRSFDSKHETAPDIEPATDADIARTARAENNHFQPTDAEGEAVVGWFDPTDDTVGFNDFFLFADHFGRIEGELTYDPRFDLNGNQRIDFADFFIFADHFGRTVANFDAGTGVAE